jgi:regulator of sigma E protease
MTTLIAFIAVIGVLIVIHELGHFIVARLSGVGVERFSIGFGPVLWRYRGPETEYCISAIPMGGYVKMMGDDENPLEGGAGPTVDPTRAFNFKPLLARFLIVFAGPGMNFVLAAVIFALLFMTIGRPVSPATLGRLVDEGPAAKAGLVQGDRVTAVNGRAVQYWDDLLQAVQESRGAPLRITAVGPQGERQVTVTPVPAKARTIFGEEKEGWDIGLTPAVIGEVVAGQPAARAGMQGGDVVLAVAGQPVSSWEELAESIRKRPGQATVFTIRRGAETLTLTVTPVGVKERGPDGKEVEVGRVGIGGSRGVPSVYVRSNPLRAMWEGAEETVKWTKLTATGLYKVVVGQLDRSNIGGPIQIAVAAGEQARQGLPNLAFFTAVISVNLALLNLLPVPMLDGGHLLFFVFEAVLGRPLSVRKREVAQQVGFVLLMLLMVYAVYNDLARIDVFRFFR